MLRAWLRGSVIGCAIAARRTPPDPTQHPYAKATTPDDIIVAVCIESIAKNFDDWKFHNKGAEWNTKSFRPNPYTCNCVLKNEKKGLLVQFRGYASPWAVYEEHTYDEYHINGLPVTTTRGQKIYEAFEKVKAAREKLAAAAAKAKREMEENEKKWNLAEKLLGLERNENGALVVAKEK